MDMESVNYGYGICKLRVRNLYITDTESVNYGYGICKPHTLRHFSVFTDMKCVNQAPYPSFLFLRI